MYKTTSVPTFITILVSHDKYNYQVPNAVLIKLIQGFTCACPVRRGRAM